jgi:hypothetical protein
MTAKEKATKLVSMSELIILAETGHKLNVKERKAIAKRHAINCCDEIIGLLNSDINPLVNYWYEIKQELENL